MSDMERSLHYSSLLWKISMIALLANMHIVSGQTEKKQLFPIPGIINKVFQTSCMPCHGSTGGRFPKSRLNFSRWEGYGASKEAEKALLICSSVSKGTMPPKSVRESKPELILTKEQVDLVCKWADELKLKVKKE
jgi:mono/diheme cytochrome c family protein